MQLKMIYFPLTTSKIMTLKDDVQTCFSFIRGTEFRLWLPYKAGTSRVGAKPKAQKALKNSQKFMKNSQKSVERPKGNRVPFLLQNIKKMKESL